MTRDCSIMIHTMNEGDLWLSLKLWLSQCSQSHKIAIQARGIWLTVTTFATSHHMITICNLPCHLPTNKSQWESWQGVANYSHSHRFFAGLLILHSAHPWAPVFCTVRSYRPTMLCISSLGSSPPFHNTYPLMQLCACPPIAPTCLHSVKPAHGTYLPSY